MLDFGFYNMDCMEGMKEFPDKYFDLAIVDPPYGEKVGKGGYMHNTVTGGVAKRRNYHTNVFFQERPDAEYFAELQRVSKNQIVWGGNYFADLLPTSQCWVVLDKKHPETINYADCELAWTSFDRASRIFRFMWNGMLQEDMKHKEKKIHPTQKPVALYEWLLDRFSKSGDKILDTHVGSASSLIACEKHDMQYVGFEIDKTYYEAAKERMRKETEQITLWKIGYNPYQE